MGIEHILLDAKISSHPILIVLIVTKPDCCVGYATKSEPRGPEICPTCFAFRSFIPTAFRQHPINMRPPRMDTAQLSLVRTPFEDPDFLSNLNTMALEH